MNKLRKCAVTAPFCVALVMPTVVSVVTAARTQDRDDQDRHNKADHRYYDPEHKDYHEWNAEEQRYWRDYWTEERRPYIDWDRASDEQRQAYWHWRHAHREHHDDRR